MHHIITKIKLIHCQNTYKVFASLLNAATDSPAPLSHANDIYYYDERWILFTLLEIVSEAGDQLSTFFFMFV